jgi:hypothetical protein
MMPKTLVILQMVAASAGLAVRGAEAPTLKVSCTFTNPAHAGSCVINATRKQDEKPAAACKPILDCLNNPRCVKSYCDATTLRQGWKLVSAK